MNKILTIMFAGLLLIAGNAQAHCGKCGVGDAPHAADAEAMATEKAEKLTTELKLTDDQKAKVQTIIKEKLDKKQAIMDEKHKAMDALHEEFKTKLGGVLSAEQMASWEAMKKDMGGMKGKCPMCKDGKMCDVCKLKKSEKCPMCKDGEMCDMCKMKKGKKGDKHEHSHGDHGHDHGDEKK